MNNDVARILVRLVGSRSPLDWQNPTWLDAALRDLAWQHPQELHALVTAAREGIPALLRETDATHTAEVRANQAIERLLYRTALRDSAARWAVEAWGQAFGHASPAPKPARPAPVEAPKPDPSESGATVMGTLPESVMALVRPAPAPTPSAAASGRYSAVSPAPVSPVPSVTSDVLRSSQSLQAPSATGSFPTLSPAVPGAPPGAIAAVDTADHRVWRALQNQGLLWRWAAGALFDVQRLDDRRLLASSSAGLTVFDSTGARRWSYDVPLTASALNAQGTVVALAVPSQGITLCALPSGATNALGGVSGAVTAMVFTPDGSTLVAATEDGNATAWDLRTMQVRFTLAGTGRRLTCLAVSPDGRLLATGSEDLTVRLWDASTGRPWNTLERKDLRVLRVAFSPDSALLAVGTLDRAVLLAEVRTGRVLRTLAGHKAPVTALAFSPVAPWLVSGSFDGGMILWDSTSGQPRGTFQGHAGKVTSLTYAPDGALLFSSGQDNTIRTWAAATGELSHTLPWLAPRTLALSPTLSTLVSSGPEHTLLLWELQRSQGERSLRGHTARPVCATFRGDGLSLASGGEDGSVRLWDVASAQSLMTFAGHRQPVGTVALGATGSVLASGSADHALKLWEPGTGREWRSIATPAPVTALAFTPDERFLVEGGLDGGLRVWEVATGRNVLTLALHKDAIAAIQFSADGRHFASVGGPVTGVWATGSTTPRFTLRSLSPAGTCVAFSPDGRLLATGGTDPFLRLWSLETGREVTQVLAAPDGVERVLFKPDVLITEGGSALRAWRYASAGATLPGRP